MTRLTFEPEILPRNFTATLTPLRSVIQYFRAHSIPSPFWFLMHTNILRIHTVCMFTLCPALLKNEFSKGDKINTLNRMLNKSLWLKGLSVDQLESTYQKQTEANNIRGYTEHDIPCGFFPTGFSGIIKYISLCLLFSSCCRSSSLQRHVNI